MIYEPRDPQERQFFTTLLASIILTHIADVVAADEVVQQDRCPPENGLLLPRSRLLHRQTLRTPSR